VNVSEPFNVRVETRAPRVIQDVTDKNAADELMDLLEDYDGIVSSGPRSWAAVITIPAAGPREAAIAGEMLIEEMAAKAGMPEWPAVRVEAIRQDVLAEQLDRTLLPDLVSTPEAADILGVSPQRLHQIVGERSDFPAPAYELRTGKLWLRSAIQAFGERKRMPGRPRRAAVAV
jgi:hypothetical protein